MTDQSRVETVKAALIWARDRGLSLDDDRVAQAAIEANDAWFLNAPKSNPSFHGIQTETVEQEWPRKGADK